MINVNFGRDLPEPEKFYDFKVAKEGDYYPETNEVYEVFKASEVGNIFPLYTKFTDKFDFKFIDDQGKEQIVYMGSYGIGTSRVMGVLVEKFHDDKGIIWPEQVAPFKVHLIGLNLDDPVIKKMTEDLYQQLKQAKIEVLFDDREEVNAGEKFGDADLIGIPYRLVVSRKNGNQVEFKKRGESAIEYLEPEKILVRLK